jgi:hypothetical protein
LSCDPHCRSLQTFGVHEACALRKFVAVAYNHLETVFFSPLI